jgi:peptide/nickel transport system permease protein
MKYLKQPYFLFGFLTLLFIITGSFYYSSVKDPGSPSKLLYDETGQIIDQAPFEPNPEYPLGSDQFGNNYIFALIEGAKYTLGLVVLITFGRMILSILGSFLLLAVPNFIRKLINSFSDMFHFAPLSIFSYLLIAPALVAFSWSYSDLTQFTITTCVLICLTVPVLSMQIANEISILSKEEFIQHAPLLGGGRIHIFLKHILPCLAPKLFLMTVQQAGQTLSILAHLAFLKIFVGGFNDITYGEEEDTYVRTFSDSFEWGGLIVQNWSFYYAEPLLVIAPVCCFVVCMIAFNLMITGIARVDKVSYRIKKKQTSVKSITASDSFIPLKKEGMNT